MAATLLSTLTGVGRAVAAPPTGAGMVLNAPIVDVASTPDGRGYWEGASDGGVFAFGGAGFYGSTGSLHLNAPIVGLTPAPDGRGYWEVASDGGVFAFGDAQFFGSATGMSPTSPIVGIASTPDGRGYWEAALDGAVFAFGDARYEGGAPAGELAVGITPSGFGYRLATASGGIYTFGGIPFYGSTGGQHLNKPVIGMSSTSGGYLTVASDGGIFTFGTAGFYGSLGGSTVYSPPSTATGASADGVTDYQRAAWTRVNICEEGGRWNAPGSIYSGGLGFSHANWDQFNTFGYPADAADASPEQQIRVAVAFATRYWGNPSAAPDQNGCTGGY